MKKVIVILLFMFSFVLAQGEHVFQYKNDVSKWSNWSQDSSFYYWSLPSGEADTTITSKEFSVDRGFRGLLAGIIEIDTTDVDSTATITVYNGEFTNSGTAKSKSVSTEAYVDMDSILVLMEVNLGAPFGWVSDTMNFYVLSDDGIFDRGSTAIKYITSSYVGKQLVTVHNPSSADDGLEWQEDPILYNYRWKSIRPDNVDTTKVIKLKFKQYVYRPGR